MKLLNAPLELALNDFNEKIEITLVLLNMKFINAQNARCSSFNKTVVQSYIDFNNTKSNCARET